jgi:hypothetical protein
MYRLLLLPVSKLTQLCRLDLSSLRVTSSSSSSSAAVTLPRLQELRLANCELTVQLLSQLLSATTVSQLHCCNLGLYHSDTWTGQLTFGQGCALLWPWLQLMP